MLQNRRRALLGGSLFFFLTVGSGLLALHLSQPLPKTPTSNPAPPSAERLVPGNWKRSARGGEHIQYRVSLGAGEVLSAVFDPQSTEMSIGSPVPSLPPPLCSKSTTMTVYWEGRSRCSQW